MMESKHTGQLGHEASDADAGAIVKSGLILALISAIALLLMFFLVNYFEKENTRAMPAVSPLAAQRVLPPGPRLQVHPEKDLVHLRAAEDSILHNYGWIMREASLVHIPIERAIELTAQRGLPSRGVERGAKIEDRASRIEDGESRP